MKAIIEEDIIVKLDSKNGIEIGNPPPRVGFERLRWNGNKIIDLIDLNEFWVRLKNNIFELHCMPVANSQLVIMNYANRFDLINNGNTIRVKTTEELNKEKIERALKKANNKFSIKLDSFNNLNLIIFNLLCYLIIYTRQQNQEIANLFDSFILDIENTFPLIDCEKNLKDFIKDLNKFVTDYSNEVNSIKKI